MYFELIKTFDGVKSYYGKIPEMPYDINSNEQFERFDFWFDDKCDEEAFFELIYDLNTQCNSLLDDGDVDYFDGEKLNALKKWLDDNMSQLANDRVNAIFGVLKSYVETAIELNTMVVVET